MNGFILFALIILTLVIGRSIFLPLLVATFLWYLTNAIAAYYRKILPYGKKYCVMNKTLCKAFDLTSFLLSLATLVGLFYAFVTQIRPMMTQLVASLPEIQSKLMTLLNYIAGQFGVTVSPAALPNITGIAANIGMGMAGALMSFGMVLVYMLFMFIEQSTFNKKIARLFPDSKRFKKINFILDSINDNMKKYMFMKTAMSAATALVSYFWLKYLGVEFAGVWAFIIFIMNYIPTFGSIVATTLPVVYVLLTAATLTTPLLVAAGLIAVQIVFGNIIEPRLTGKTLNLSTLAILINLMFWGMIWGAVGMFFSVPLLVATFIICSQFDKTRWIAVLLSADGEIPEKEED